ncbi:MAG: PAS domain-containing sensor histidine kinase, partial [Bacteroidales bacterium]|nr:PAS domain-containing sensor histidine kinase [Bacteroidales bacterium]
MSVSLFSYNLLGIMPIALEDVFRSIRDGAVILDVKKRVVDYNSVAGTFWDDFDKRVLAKGIEDMIEIPESIPDEGTEYQTRNTVKIDSVNKKLFLKVRITPVTDRRGSVIGFLIMLYDITDFREYQIKLNELNETKDKLFSIVSHDLRGPAGTILELIRLLREELEELDRTEIENMLETIIVQANSTYRLIENLLFWSRNQIGNIGVNISGVDVMELTDEIFLEMKYSSRRKELNMSNLTGDERIVSADRDMLKIILRNLINNSIKYCNLRGNVSVECCYTGKGSAVIFVKDDGTGIPPEKLKVLFELSPKSSVKGTLGEQGSSLGLVICKELAERQGGSISAESKPGEGSVFCVTLPANRHN